MFQIVSQFQVMKYYFRVVTLIARTLDSDFNLYPTVCKISMSLVVHRRLARLESITLLIVPLISNGY